jgi:hypothetical protein
VTGEPDDASARVPDDTWGVDFFQQGTTRWLGGFVRLLRVGERCWYWAYLVGSDLGLVVVRDHEVTPPRRDAVLDVRADGLWAELVCETPGEHWTIGLEAFAVRLDAPVDALHGEIGERLPVGLDLEWETGDVGPPPAIGGSVHGDVLVAADRIELDGAGVFRRTTAPETGWPTAWSGALLLDRPASWVSVGRVESGTTIDGLPVPLAGELADGRTVRCEARAVVPVPLQVEASGRGSVLMRVLTRVHGDGGVTGSGWLEMLHSRVPA